MTIWKFRLADIIDMPLGAKPLCVQTQGDTAFIWAAVNPNLPLAPRRFYVIGTGHPVGAVGGYLGTYQLSGGALVFHVFEGGAA